MYFLFRQDWLPNNKSAVLIDDFKSVKDLAQYILFLNDNDSEYIKYLEHKYNTGAPISNNQLIGLINERIYFDLIENFECLMCHVTDRGGTIKFANHLHYGCKDSVLNYPRMLENIQKDENWDLWEHSFRQGKCEAYVIRNLIMKNVTYTNEQFITALMKALTEGYC